MELLKSNPIIDPKYKPSLSQDHLEYFKRAMAFAQTNYAEQIKKVQKTRFRVLSAPNFFEEYAWTLSCNQYGVVYASDNFMYLSRDLAPFYNSFWDLNNFPKLEIIQSKIVDEKLCKALHSCADTINRGIKLFGWDEYKENFLNTPEKLMALPLLGIDGAKSLARGIGLNHDQMSEARLYPLTKAWGFENARQLCEAIQKYVPMELRIIELILWYSTVTFDHNTANL